MSLAERENKGNMRSICDMISAAVDMMSLLLIVLPLYPKTIDGYVYAVNLLVYGETTTRSLFPYWALFVALMVVGMIRLILI